MILFSIGFSQSYCPKPFTSIQGSNTFGISAFVKQGQGSFYADDSIFGTIEHKKVISELLNRNTQDASETAISSPLYEGLSNPTLDKPSSLNPLNRWGIDNLMDPLNYQSIDQNTTYYPINNYEEAVITNVIPRFGSDYPSNIYKNWRERLPIAQTQSIWPICYEIQPRFVNGDIDQFSCKESPCVFVREIHSNQELRDLSEMYMLTRYDPRYDNRIVVPFTVQAQKLIEAERQYDSAFLLWGSKKDKKKDEKIQSQNLVQKTTTIVLIDSGVNKEVIRSNFDNIDNIIEYCFSSSVKKNEHINRKYGSISFCSEGNLNQNCTVSCAHGTLVAGIILNQLSKLVPTRKISILSIQVSSKKISSETKTSNENITWAEDVLSALRHLEDEEVKTQLGDNVIINLSLDLPVANLTSTALKEIDKGAYDEVLNSETLLFDKSCVNISENTGIDYELLQALIPLWEKGYFILSASGNQGEGPIYEANGIRITDKEYDRYEAKETKEIRFSESTYKGDNIKYRGAVSWPGCFNDTSENKRFFTVSANSSVGNINLDIVDMEVELGFDKEEKGIGVLWNWACSDTSETQQRLVREAGCNERSTSWATAFATANFAACRLSGKEIKPEFLKDVIDEGDAEREHDDYKSNVISDPKTPNLVSVKNICPEIILQD